MIETTGSGLRRSGKILVLILPLVLYILSAPVITAFREIVGLSYKIPNLKPVGPVKSIIFSLKIWWIVAPWFL